MPASICQSCNKVRCRPCLKWIKIVAQVTAQNDRLLWDHCNGTPQSFDAQLSNIQPVNKYATSLTINKPEQCCHQRRLASACTTNNPNAFTTIYGDRKSVEG